MILLKDNHAGADETDTGNHLRRHARGIEPARKRKLRDNHEQRGAERHDKVRADTGLLGAELALEADETAHQACQQQAEYQIPVNSHDAKILKKPRRDT